MSNISFLVDVLTLLAIASGVIFGIAEVRRARIDRRDAAALHIFDSSFTVENMSALLRIFDLPENASADIVYANEDLVYQAQSISTQMESWGIQVFHNKIELHTLDLMIGSAVRVAWNRLRNFNIAQRKKYNTNGIGEWFQWLAERLEEYPAPEKEVGAYVAFKDWKP